MAKKTIKAAAAAVHDNQAHSKESAVKARKTERMASATLKLTEQARRTADEAVKMANAHKDWVRRSIVRREHRLSTHMAKYKQVAKKVGRNKVERGRDMVARGKAKIKEAQQRIAQAMKELDDTKKTVGGVLKEAQKSATEQKTVAAKQKMERIQKEQQRIIQKAEREARHTQRFEWEEIRHMKEEVRHGRATQQAGKKLLNNSAKAAAKATEKPGAAGSATELAKTVRWMMERPPPAKKKANIENHEASDSEQPGTGTPLPTRA